LIDVLYGILAFKDNSCGKALIIALIVLKLFNSLSAYFSPIKGIEAIIFNFCLLTSLDILFCLIK